jgi:SAM-dependent methyltransferase
VGIRETFEEWKERAYRLFWESESERERRKRDAAALANTKPLGDFLHVLVAKYARGGSILDLGCGAGTLVAVLNPNSYNFYTGVDLSEAAIERARATLKQNPRPAKIEYFHADISTFAVSRIYDVIVLGDAIHSVPGMRIRPMLKRYSEHLKEGGTFLVKFSGRHGTLLPVIESEYAIVERREPPGSIAFVVVFGIPGVMSGLPKENQARRARGAGSE